MVSAVHVTFVGRTMLLWLSLWPFLAITQNIGNINNNYHDTSDPTKSPTAAPTFEPSEPSLSPTTAKPTLHPTSSYVENPCRINSCAQCTSQWNCVWYVKYIKLLIRYYNNNICNDLLDSLLFKYTNNIETRCGDTCIIDTEICYDEDNLIHQEFGLFFQFIWQSVVRC